MKNNFYKKFYNDTHYFKGEDRQYFMTKKNIAGRYETFLITDELKIFLL